MDWRSLMGLQVLLLTAVGCEGSAERCANPKSILLANGEPSGFVRCEDGAVNRVEAVAADPLNPQEGCRGTEDEFECASDADCGEGPNGVCVHYESSDSGGPANGQCGCEYTCSTDADCGEGKACVPPEVRGGELPSCVPATCLSSASCASGECGYGVQGGCGGAWLACRDAALDVCHGSAECSGPEPYCVPVRGQLDCNGAVCAEVGEHFECIEGHYCGDGRPLLVAGQARVASAEVRADWAAPAPPAAPAPAAPDAATAAALAAHYRTVAALEHASVGSFARFTLQLLAIGAPPELLLATQAAAADEVRHAQAMYALASRLGGAPVGPGPLSLEGAMPALSVEGTLAGLIDEACIGETLGAAEAAACAEATVDPGIRAVLLTIAADEARHAALAWKSLRWILSAHPEAVEFARGRFEAAVAEHTARLALPPAPRGDAQADATAWGRPPAAARAAVQRAALERVVRSVGAAVFGREA